MSIPKIVLAILVVDIAAAIGWYGHMEYGLFVKP